MKFVFDNNLTETQIELATQLSKIDNSLSGEEKLKQCKKICLKDSVLEQEYNKYIQKYNLKALGG